MSAPTPSTPTQPTQTTTVVKELDQATKASFESRISQLEQEIQNLKTSSVSEPAELVTTSSGNSFWINVKDFGAKGDGVNDDTSAIKAALNDAYSSGRNVLVPPGTYKITQTLQVKSYVALNGAGIGVTKINYYGSGAAIEVTDITGGKEFVQHARVANLSIKLFSPAREGLRVEGAWRGDFENLDINANNVPNSIGVNVVYGKAITAASGASTLFNTFKQIRSVRAYKALNLKGNPLSGLTTEKTINLNSFVNSTFSASNYGIYIGESARDNTFKDCYIGANSQWGVYIVGNKYTTQNRNTFINCTFEANTPNAGGTRDLYIANGAVRTVIISSLIKKSGIVNKNADNLAIVQGKDILQVGGLLFNESDGSVASINPNDGIVINQNVLNKGLTIKNTLNPTLTIEEPGVRSDGHVVGRINFDAQDSARNIDTYAQFDVRSTKIQSGQEKGELRFRAMGNGNLEDSLVIVGGDIGVGTTDPQYKLDVAGEARAVKFVETSDIDLKKDITPIESSLEKVDNISGVTFNWKDPERGTDRQIGIIAQEIERVLPEVVSTSNDGYKAVDYGKITALLIEAFKELKAEVELLKEKVESLGK